MKKFLLSAALLTAVMANSQTVLFEDGFESYADFSISGVGNWTLIDGDEQDTYGVTLGGLPVTFTNSGAPMAYIVMNSTMTTPALGVNWAGHTGSKAMVAMASIPFDVFNPEFSNNDWMISPAVQLASSGNSVKFWAKGISATYPELFKVGVSTTGTAPADFTYITPTAGVTPSTTWTEYTYSLDNYQGQNVYIGIQCLSFDAFAFLVDDFSVSTTLLKTDDFFKSNFSVYPNPAGNVINVAAKNAVAINKIQITDINGRTVKQVEVSGLNEVQVNTSDLNSGVYFLSATTNEGSGTTKFVKS